jgi:hypothetical protein
MLNYSSNSNQGSMLVLTIVITGLFLVMMLGTISLGIMQQKLNVSNISKTQALHIAEAGVNYYRWVLYHNHEDYCNSEVCKSGPDYGPYGPYTYTDFTGTIKGYYELYITPPAIDGSTIVNIKSVGWTEDHPNIKREIEVQCGISSWSTYSTLANAKIRFGAGTETWGPIHSNNGIRFDGLSHNIITSSIADYNDDDHGGGNEFGVHTHLAPTDPLPPSAVPERLDVFMAGRSFPASVVSFDLLGSYINKTYAKATTTGIVFDPRTAGIADPYSVNTYWGCENSGSSCDEGFHITLKNDNTFDISGVTSVRNDCGGSPSHSILSEGSLNNYPIPSNGIIFVKHHVWVDGQINNSRITILAFEEPFTGNSSDININNDILYTNYDGTDSMGLIAQRDINAGQYSENDLRIDAALIAKEGRIGREYYNSGCTSYIRDTITINGSLATNNRYGFAYTDGTGYQTRNLIYDNNLTFIPPPHFPTTGEYTFISWKEK